MKETKIQLIQSKQNEKIQNAWSEIRRKTNKERLYQTNNFNFDAFYCIASNQSRSNNFDPGQTLGHCHISRKIE